MLTAVYILTFVVLILFFKRSLLMEGVKIPQAYLDL